MTTTRALLSTLVLAAVACAGDPPPAPVAPPPAPTHSAAPVAIVPVAPPAHKLWAPPAAKKPVVHEYFGTKVTDDYEWLEPSDQPDVKAFTETQNAAGRTFLDALPERPVVRARVAQLYGASAANYLAAHYAGGLLFILKDAPPKQQPIIVTRNANGDAASEKVVVDPNVIDPSGKTTIDFYVPSPDGRYIAVSLSKGGSESGDVHTFDLATTKENGGVVTGVNGGTAGGSVAWDGEGKGFYYTRYPRAGERAEADMGFYQQVWFHKVGWKAETDVYSIGKEFPRIAEVDLTRSDDGKFVLARVANGDGGEFEHHVLDTKRGVWQRLSTFADELTTATFGGDGKLYVVSRKGASRGKIVAFARPFDKPAEEVVPEGDAVIEDIAVTRSAIYSVELVGGPSRVRRISLGGKSEPLAREPSSSKKHAPAMSPPVSVAQGERGLVAAELPIAPVSSVTAVERIGEDLLLRDETYLENPAWYRYRAAEHRLVKTDMAKPAPANMSDVEVLRETCASPDGTKVPISIMRKKGMTLDGKAPTLLTAYGGYGVSMKPRLRAWYRVWLDQGGVLAQANLRGGGEMGESWHKDGRLTKKQNVFDDFYACAKTLVSLGYTKPEHLAITGRSNGGLLMGAALVQHPEMYRAVVSGVGIYDMLRVELSPNGAFNVTEFGTVKDQAQFNALYAYSPFHNVRDGVKYPSTLFLTGQNDPRVDPYHSRKMLARLQEASYSDNPILLRASADTGHGMGTPLNAEIDELTDMLTFLLHELGVQVKDVSAK